jgi:hypothetical protein
LSTKKSRRQGLYKSNMGIIYRIFRQSYDIDAKPLTRQKINHRFQASGYASKGAEIPGTSKITILEVFR